MVKAGERGSAVSVGVGAWPFCSRGVNVVVTGHRLITGQLLPFARAQSTLQLNGSRWFHARTGSLLQGRKATVPNVTPQPRRKRTSRLEIAESALRRTLSCTCLGSAHLPNESPCLRYRPR